MNLIIKIILTIFATITLSFLIFFTFMSEGYITDFASQSDILQPWVYKVIQNDTFKLSYIEKPEDYNELKLKNISVWNNIFYKEWSITVEKTNNHFSIYLEKWIYFFDINDISNQYSIFFEGYSVKNMWPGTFMINAIDKDKKSVFSLSSKLRIDFLDVSTSESLAQIDLFPNMYLLAIPRYNKSIKNADLWKIITSHTLDMLTSPIYSLTENIIW